MPTFTIKIAERIIKIQSVFTSLQMYCQNYLVNSDDLKPDISIVVREEDVLEEAKKYRYSESFVEKELDTSYLQYIESIVAYRLIVEALLSYDVLLLHGSVISTKGAGYIFTAPSGVGKTLRTRLWLDLYPSSFVVNGDKPLIRITDSHAIAYGTPWCGKEGMNTNTKVPLRAIFLLERANEYEDTAVEEVSLRKAIPFLLQQIYMPKDAKLMRKTLSLLESIDGKVRVFKFRSTPSEKSVRLAYEAAQSVVNAAVCR